MSRQQYANDFHAWAASHFADKLDSIYRPMNVDKGCYIRLQFNKSVDAWKMSSDVRDRFGRSVQGDSPYCIVIQHNPRLNYLICRAGF